MFCTQCGIQISEDAVYCINCGAKVIKEGVGSGLAEELVEQEAAAFEEAVIPKGAETIDCISSDNTIERKEGGNNDTKGEQKSSTFWAGVIVIAVAGFGVWLLVLFLRWLSSAFIPAIVVIAGGYILYHKVLAKMITEFFYERTPKELQLLEGMTDSKLLETLSDKFNYPYFKGVHYGPEGECVIEGKYSMYSVVFSENNIAEISYIAEEDDDKKKRTVLLEALAIQDYINKFFNPDLKIDVVKDMKRLKLAEGQRKAVAVVCTIASVLIVAAIAWDYISPGSLQSMVVPGIEVRSAYLSQYSKQVTIEEAFDNFFDNCKWTKYDSEGYTNVVFTGTCIYLGERADVRIIFKLTGEHFIVDSLDINGRTQSDLILYGVLSAVYEDY